MLNKTFALGSGSVWSVIIRAWKSHHREWTTVTQYLCVTGCYEELQGVRGWRHLRLLEIHPEFTSFFRRCKGNLCCAPLLQVLGIKNGAGDLLWALPCHHQASELSPAGFFWDRKKGTPAAMPSLRCWSGPLAATCSTPSSWCRAEPLVEALYTPRSRAGHPTADHKADTTSLKERREERWNSRSCKKEWIWGEGKIRGRKGIRKDMSQLLRHCGGSVRRRITVSGKNYKCCLLSKLRLVN